MSPGSAHVCGQVLHRAAHDALGEDVEREADDFTAAAIAECLYHQIIVSINQLVQLRFNGRGLYNALAQKPWNIRLQLNIRMRPVRADMHGIRAYTVETRWKPQIDHLVPGDAHVGGGVGDFGAHFVFNFGIRSWR